MYLFLQGLPETTRICQKKDAEHPTKYQKFRRPSSQSRITSGYSPGDTSYLFPRIPPLILGQNNQSGSPAPSPQRRRKRLFTNVISYLLQLIFPGQQFIRIIPLTEVMDPFPERKIARNENYLIPRPSTILLRTRRRPRCRWTYARPGIENQSGSSSSTGRAWRSFN